MRARVALLSTVASAMAPARTSRRVAVVGGGSAGVIAARFLKRAGHRPEIFEAGTSFGGIWADDPTNDVVYKNLQTNLPTVVMQSPDLDFPPTLPSYVTKRALGAYIEDYARVFDVASLATFGAKVTSVAPTSSADGDERWKVDWTCDGTSHTAVYDAVIVANGHYEEPYAPKLPGEADWLDGDASRAVVHSREYDEPEAFRGRSVLVVGGRSSGVDISRELRGVAKWVYVLEKGCAAPLTHEGEAVTHVPLGTRLCSDGRLRCGAEAEGEAESELLVAGPPIDRVVLATGYCYAFPFLDEEAVDLRFRQQRWVSPLYQHIMHARRPTLGFIGIPLAVPCPIPFFECQAALLAEQWARPSDGPEALTSESERVEWVEQRRAAVGERTQDTHLTGAAGGSAWSYMRELLARVHATSPPTEEGDTWLARTNWDERLTTVESVYRDRGARYPKLPWHRDSYRRVEYSVDWASGEWRSDDSKALEYEAEEEPKSCAGAA